MKNNRSAKIRAALYPPGPTKEDQDFYEAFCAWPPNDQKAYLQAQEACNALPLDRGQVQTMHGLCKKNGMTNQTKWVRILGIAAEIPQDKLNSLL